MSGICSKYSGDVRVAIHKAAVLDRVGVTTFYIDNRPDLGGVASSVHKLEPQFVEVSVPCVTLDQVSKAAGVDPSLIKIDVEGAEWSVIQGARSLIARARPSIVFEFWESWWERGIHEIFTFLHPDYDLRVLQTGEAAWARYSGKPPEYFATNNVIDIGCIPRSH